MSNRERCISMIDKLDEEQLSSVVTWLSDFLEELEEALDMAYCQQLLEDYLNDPDPSKHDSISLEDLAKELDITLA